MKEVKEKFYELSDIDNIKKESAEEVTTLHDLLEKVEGIDISDVSYDMEVYFEYTPEDVGKDDYDTYLNELSKQLHCVSYSDTSAAVDMYKYVENNFDLLCDLFDVSGEDKDECIGNIVSDIMPGIISGFVSDSTYAVLLGKSKSVECKITENEEDNSDTVDNVEEVVDNSEISQEVEQASEENELPVNVASSNIDVLVSSEQSAVSGYDAFLQQCQETLPEGLFEVLQKEIEEIKQDELAHIEKLNKIKEAFHLSDAETSKNQNDEIVEEA